MSYTKTVWQSGDVVTAEKLNNLENGVESANSMPVVYATLVGEPEFYIAYYDAEITHAYTPSELRETLGKRVEFIIKSGNDYFPTIAVSWFNNEGTGTEDVVMYQVINPFATTGYVTILVGAQGGGR